MPKDHKVEKIFKPLQSDADKQKNTIDAARAINEREAAARERKTARLRAARLAKEAEEPKKPTAIPRAVRKGH
jgi:hypothetical protein